MSIAFAPAANKHAETTTNVVRIRTLAEELGIATGTVKKHVSHMLSKTGLTTRTALARRE